MKKFFFYAVIFLILGLSPSTSFTQIVEDTPEVLNKKLNTSLSDSARAMVFLQLSKYYFYTSLDSSLLYGKKALDLAERLRNHKMILTTRSHVGTILHNQSQYGEARDLFMENLLLAKRVSDSLEIAKALKNIGAAFANENHMDKAVERYIDALKIFENLDNKEGMAVLYGVLGNLYLRNRNYDNALEHYQQAGELFRELGSEGYLATVIMNTGIVYKNKGEFQKAKDYYAEAAELYKKLGNKTGEAHCLGNIGILNLKTKDYEKSIEYNQQAFEYYDQNNMRQNAIIALVDIGIAYDSLNNSQKAFQHYQNAYARTDTSEMLSLRVELELVLSTYYKTQGNYKKALDHHARYLDGSLALIEKENSQKLDELLTKYETEQKEKRIELLEKQQKIDRIMNLSWFGLFVSFLIISAILFYNYKRKQRHNRLLEERNKQILQQKEEITTQNEILQQQKEEITSQRDEIESKQYILLKQKHKLEMVHKELTNSIHYAKYIQSASLPTTKNLQEILNEYFIFFQPQNIVGGDFYWTLKKNGKVFVAAADCTGHGVPGGFMSMLGMTFLDEIVHREGIEEVDQILNRLRQLVIDSLHQKNTLGTLKDGMYLGLCCLDREKGVLEYAGANTPLYIVYENIAKENSDTIISQNNLHLEEVKPDLMPISIHPRIRSFQKQVFPMNDIKALYMSTDGYTDQFGGEKRKKFGKKAFKNMLLTVADKTMEKQQQIITQTYEQWKGENEQIDDVMVMGVRISFK